MDEFQNHLTFTHAFWKRELTSDSIVIDATCGNGHDTLFLAPLVKQIYAIDIQADAIIETKAKLKECSNVSFFNQCHSTFPKEISEKSVSLVVYNLGYLPKGDKNFTTKVETTLQSIENALKLINDEGLICITCYPGHAEGKLEEETILNFVKGLDKSVWTVSFHQWINRNNAPSVVLIHKQYWKRSTPREDPGSQGSMRKRF